MNRFLFFLMVVVSVGCFRSPLLFHAEGRGKQAATSSTSDAGVCALYFPKADLCASIEWPTAPVVRRYSEAVVKFWSKSQSSSAGPYRKPDLKIGFEPIMPNMGEHPGVYRVKKIYFSMGDLWEIRLQLRRSETDIDEQASVRLML